MSPKLQPIRGTHDVLPEDFEAFHAVVTAARELARLYAFREMATPIFESTEVFSRSMGETSDVVSKEMFSFDTKGGESVTLRPEFTAGIARAFISNGLQQHLPLKLFSTGPLFRYERPQKGRQRQFHQINFESLGDDSPQADIELITLAAHVLYTISGHKDCVLHINTLGDQESRQRYREALVAFLTPFRHELSEDSQRRLEVNPLRILDSKDSNDKRITETAPILEHYLSDSAKQRFDHIVSVLSSNSISFINEFKVNSALVRGLDYYSHTVFEFISEDKSLGAQNTVLAGGRYDGLIEQMGGKPTPAIGFAAGVERLLLLNAAAGKNLINNIKIAILAFDDVEESSVHAIVSAIRGAFYRLLKQRTQEATISVEVAWHGSLKKRLERASKQGITHVILLGPEEMKKQSCQLKYMQTGEQQEVALADLQQDALLQTLFLQKGAHEF